MTKEWSLGRELRTLSKHSTVNANGAIHRVNDDDHRNIDSGNDIIMSMSTVMMHYCD